MIIRCTKCETSFRFEDQLMAGEGIWVRCSRCTQVFFQDNPDYVESAPPPREAELGETALRPTDVDELETIAIEASVSELQQALAEPVVPEKANKLAAVGKFIAYGFLVLSTVTLLAGVSFWVFPEARQQAMSFFAPYCPVLEAFSAGKKTTGPATSQLLLQDIRQHFVNNWLLGNLWVVEGTAVNRGQYALTRVQVRGRLYDTNGNVLGEKLSFCGNFLNDAELSSMAEEDILQKLTQPSDSSLRPGGQLPFMIVLPHDQSSVAKTTVMVAGVEKLLE